MVQEVKAYKTEDGQLHVDESNAIRHSLVYLLQGIGGLDGLIDRMINVDSKIVLLLQQYRKLNPHVKEKAK